MTLADVTTGSPVEPETPRRFSYSAHNMFLKCQRKYWLKYIAHAAKDPDSADDTKALDYGSIVHKMAELTEYRREMFTKSAFVSICEQYPSIDYDTRYAIAASLFAVYDMHAKSKLHVVAIEHEIGDADIIGFIDLIVVDDNGNWRICDLKTNGRIMENLFARLAHDPQLNLYAAYAEKVASAYGLDVAKFAGVHYRVVAKPKIVPKNGEKYLEYVERVKCPCYDVFIPKVDLNPSEALEKMKRIKAQANELTEKTAECNRQSCLDYERPCEYWSQCHSGNTFSQCRYLVRATTMDSSLDMTLPSVDDDISLLM